MLASFAAKSQLLLHSELWEDKMLDLVKVVLSIYLGVRKEWCL